MLSECSFFLKVLREGAVSRKSPGTWGKGVGRRAKGVLCRGDRVSFRGSGK